MFALGFIGAFLPVLPTTPLMILALWGFSNGSESLHDWLYNHPKFGGSLRDWDQHRMIPIKAKVMAISMMSLSATYLIFFSGAPNIAIICALGLMSYGAIYVLLKPSRLAVKKEEVSIEKPKDATEEIVEEEITPPSAP